MAKLKNHVTKQELELLDIIQRSGPCTVDHIHETRGGNDNLLATMRKVHKLLRKGYLKQVVVDNQRFYKTKSKLLELKGVDR